MASKRLIETMSGYMKGKLAALTAPMANAYENAVVFNKIKNLVATFRHRKSTKTSSRFLPVNTKENNKYYQNSEAQQIDYKARSLRSNQALAKLGRYVATKHAQGSLGRYVATEHEHSSLRSDRARTQLGRYVATELKPTFTRYIATCQASKRSSFGFSFESSSKRFSFRLNRSRPVRLQKGPPLGSLLNPHRNAFRFVSIGVSRPVRPLKGPPLGSLLNPHRNAFRFVSIGVSFEILRRKQLPLKLYNKKPQRLVFVHGFRLIV
ncbi:hypothetical protein IGI04_030131 [Brassica rapa subsp. trilocularis]|uniref:Uncharacterized protein n=1 Tax=Brassica rapa subsp. trilocularis TaxID=1813537 RepID=A0ABQ7LPT4_BRACM|nr:hypothetical protein IGI04_030131 [Brassica rapa subsp. trilocularis]